MSKYKLRNGAYRFTDRPFAGHSVERELFSIGSPEVENYFANLEEERLAKEVKRRKRQRVTLPRLRFLEAP